MEFDEEEFGVPEYLLDLASTTETAIALGSSRTNANYEALDIVRPAFEGCMKALSDGKESLRTTKPVRFTDNEGMTFCVEAPVSVQVQNNADTQEGAVKTQSTVEGVNCQPLAVRPRTKQEFYCADSNLWMTQMHIARVGNNNVHIGFRVEAIHVLWDLSRTSSLRAFLHEQGATIALLNMLQHFCPQESSRCEKDAQGRVLLRVLDICPSQWCEEEQMRALGLLSLVNLAKAELAEELSDAEKEARSAGAEGVIQTITGASPELFEQIIDLCGRYMTNCGNRGLYALDRSIGGAVGKALAPYSLACEARKLLLRLYGKVQDLLNDVRKQRAVCCGGPACLPATVEGCDALHRKFESLVAVTITERPTGTAGQKRPYIRSERIAVY